MNLYNQLQYDQLIRNGKPENRDKDSFPVVKLFLPGSACTWLINELDPQEPNLAFGLCDLGMGYPELGYVDLEEISAVTNRYGLSVEQDVSFVGKYPISIYAAAARMCDKITENEEFLKKANTNKFTP